MLNENLARRKRNLKIVELWKRGKTSSDIAASLKVTRSTVMGIVNRAREKGILDYRPKPEKKVTKPTRQLPSMPKAKKDPIEIKEIDPVIIIPEPIPENIDPVSFDKLTRRMCKYVVNESTITDQYLFCGKTRLNGNSYCEEHHKLCYVSIAKYNRKQSVTFKRSKYDPRS